MKIVSTIVFLLTVYFLAGQDSDQVKKKWEVNGYLKNLESLTFDQKLQENYSGYLLHNRLNIKYKPSDQWTVAAEFRNRFIWGEEVKLTPNYAVFLRNENEKINLQKVWIDQPSLVLHTNIERLYVDYHKRKYSVRIGRQRINWGLTTTWNPNDIFNTYNFLDFDYEERPGSDGAKFTYAFNEFSNAEIAYTQTGTEKGSVAAMRYSLNKGGYDMHFIAGWFNKHPTFGVGWAGNINEAGFKGEIQYFIPSKDSLCHLNISSELDYLFAKGWYVNIGFLFTNTGLYKPVANREEVNFKISPENLMPTKWNVIITTSKELTPLFTASISTLYSPGINLMIVFPTLQYNIATNLDVNVVWQSLFLDLSNKFQAVTHRGFFRIKWSF